MPKFVIERNVPGAGKMSAGDLKGISQKSCGVLREMGPRVQWQQSYVTDDKIYCVYIAESENDVIEHLDPPRLAAFERVLFEFARPRTVVVTTPNQEYNVRWETLPAGRFEGRNVITAAARAVPMMVRINAYSAAAAPDSSEK